MEALQCYSCDRNDIFSGLDTCGDVSIPTDQNTKTCSESFCMSISATMANGNSAQPSQKMNCPGDIETFVYAIGTEIWGFCGYKGSGCHSLPDAPTSPIGAINDLEICCCSDNLWVILTVKIKNLLWEGKQENI